MLVDENTKAEIDAENQAIIDELEGKDLISDADVTEVENKNNLFSE